MKTKLLFTCLFMLGVAYGQTLSADDYIAQYKDLAIKNMQTKKVPASITLAQGLLESGNGNSSLAKKANNHFGIKCHKGWNGGTYYQDDDAPNECFRSYSSVLESYNDHADFLLRYDRYKSLFDLDITDYKGWANGLKAAGYATNPKYASLLINLIEKYNLSEYDKMGLDNNYAFNNGNNNNNNQNNNSNNSNTTVDKGQIININGLRALKVGKGQTKESVALEYDIKVKKIEKINELGENDELSEGQIIFLENKRASAEPAYKYHIVKEGDTFYSIAQTYGMKTTSLMKKNRMWYGSFIKPGDKLSLRKKVPLRAF